MTNAILPFATFSFSLEENNPRVWSSFRAYASEQNDYYFKDSLGATSAAPTFFPHKVTNVTIDSKEKKWHDIDGGIFANSPISLAIAAIGPYMKGFEGYFSEDGLDVEIISIGTGFASNTNNEFIPPKSYFEGVLGYGLVYKIIDLIMAASEQDSIAQAKILFSTKRIDVELDESQMRMDNSDPKNLQELSDLALNHLKNNKKEFSDYVKCLFKNEKKKRCDKEPFEKYSKELVVVRDHDDESDFGLVEVIDTST